jgi:hypothetical protein
METLGSIRGGCAWVSPVSDLIARQADSMFPVLTQAQRITDSVIAISDPCV